MRTFFFAFLISTIVAFVVTPWVRDFALRRGWVDVPDAHRKRHRTPVPRVGGVAIATAFFVPIVALFFWDNQVSDSFLGDRTKLLGLVVGSFAMVTLGLIDDIRDLRASLKFVVQLAVATLVYVLGYRIVQVGNPFGDPIQLGWLAFPVTLLWIVGIVNAINLIDGLDGLASGVSLFTVATLFILGMIHGNVVVGLTMAALAGSLLGFLRYNFNPASVFMGDSGSLFVGFLLAATSISGSSKSSTVVSLLIPLLALGLPVMDTTLTVFRRVISGRHPFAADRQHVHYRMLDRGLSQRQVVLTLYGACALLGLGAMTLVYSNSIVAAVVLGVSLLMALVIGRALGYLSWSEVSRSLRYGLRRQTRLKDHLAAIETAAAGIRGAASPDEALRALEQLALAVDADGVQLSLRIQHPGGQETYEHTWPAVPASPPEGARVVELPLRWSLDRVSCDGQLSLHWGCDAEVLQLPESGGYDWISMVLRDRLLELASPGSQRSASVARGSRAG